MDTASIFIGFRVSEIDRLETNRAQQWVIHTGPHTPARLFTSTECRLSLNGIKFQRRHPEGPAFSPAGRGISRDSTLHCARDPSLRLKNGSVRDGARADSTNDRQIFNLSHYLRLRKLDNSLSVARRLGSGNGVPSTNKLVALFLICVIVPRRSCVSSCTAGSRSPSVAAKIFAQSSRMWSSTRRCGVRMKDPGCKRYMQPGHF